MELLWQIQKRFKLIKVCSPASWSSGNAFVSGAKGVTFKSRVGQIEHRVVEGSPLLRHLPGRNDAEMGSTNSVHASA